jgi:hypothetical protein
MLYPSWHCEHPSLVQILHPTPQGEQSPWWFRYIPTGHMNTQELLNNIFPSGQVRQKDSVAKSETQVAHPLGHSIIHYIS